MPGAVFVSDDSVSESHQNEARAAVAEYLFATYLSGPRRGLCANRNHVIEAVRTSHFSLLDDDAVVGRDFVKKAMGVVQENTEIIVSGSVLEDGKRLVSPSNQTLLGHFGRPPTAKAPLQNIHLNCNVFPTAAVKNARFDERITYGYEDCDFCAQLAARGWPFEHRPELVNSHLPPARAVASAKRHWLAERARFMTVVRRLIIWNPDPLGLLRFAAIAPPHLAASAIRRRAWGRVLHGGLWLVVDIATAVRERSIQDVRRVLHPNARTSQ